MKAVRADRDELQSAFAGMTHTLASVVRRAESARARAGAAERKRPTKRARMEAAALLRDRALHLLAVADELEARAAASPIIPRHRAKAERYAQVVAYLTDTEVPRG